MIYDYLASKLDEYQPHLNELNKIENKIGEAKKIRNKEEQKQLLKQLEKKSKQKRRELYDSKEPSAIYKYLVATKKADPDAFREIWKEREKDKDVSLLEPLQKKYHGKNFQDPDKDAAIDLAILSPYSFILRFEFTLKQPYLSRDEQDFYIIDNPVRKDKIFKFPYVAPMSWKGSLKAALRQLGYKDQQPEIQRLFGSKKSSDEQEDLFLAGRLYFFPTFFERKSLEVINPHDCNFRTGVHGPILIESVPRGTKGVFTLLYVPFVGCTEVVGAGNEKMICCQVGKDIKIVAVGLRALFRIYGFGAKTSSGFGGAQEKINGHLRLRIVQLGTPNSTDIAEQSSQVELPRYLETPGRLISKYRNPDGSFREYTEMEVKKMSKKEKQLYVKAKAWWQREGKSFFENAGKQVEVTKDLPQVTSWWRREFTSFESLAICANEAESALLGMEAYHEK